MTYLNIIAKNGVLVFGEWYDQNGLHSYNCEIKIVGFYY